MYPCGSYRCGHSGYSGHRDLGVSPRNLTSNHSNIIRGFEDIPFIFNIIPSIPKSPNRIAKYIFTHVFKFNIPLSLSVQCPTTYDLLKYILKFYVNVYLITDGFWAISCAKCTSSYTR